jgi:predicted outer membrane lipoprotein
MKRWSNCLTVLGIWVLTSLLAIAYIGSHPYLGLVIAVLGGIAFGVVAFMSYEAEQREKKNTDGQD